MTNLEGVKNIGKSVIVRLENQKMIALLPKDRIKVYDEIFEVVRTKILSESDLRDKVYKTLDAKAEELTEGAFSQSDKFKAGKKALIEKLGCEEHNGFHFLKPIKDISKDIGVYLMKTPLIEEVFEADDVLEKAIVDAIKKFDPTQRV